jgi:hypothetical protein
MREPQVDTFCRCVKKVKKTLKARPGSTSERGEKDRIAAEGRAIAICTKSVLQSKGRTIRKVRCRDNVLETQPMKGGVDDQTGGADDQTGGADDQKGGADDQKGGRFKWMGVDTPVFNNETVGEWNGFPVMLNLTEKKKEQFNGWIAKYNPVVRMVSEGDGELPVHELLRKMLIDTPPFNQPFVKMHFNLVVGLDAVYPVDYNATLEKVKSQNDATKTQKLESVGGRFGTDKWFGLVTRTQMRDVADLDPEPQRNAMCAFLRVLLRIDGRMIHADLHDRNMAVMFDGTPVIHDVGRMKIRDAADMPGAPRSRFLRNALYSRFDNPNYYMGLSQHFYIARMFKTIRKAYGEVFPKPTKEDGWVQNYKPSIESAKKFNTWLDSPATGGDGIETNYIQIARVYDILSVLKGLSDLPRFTAAGQPAQLTTYYYARKAAVTLTNHLLGGYATEENVGKIIRSFLALSGTMGECGGKPAAGEDPKNPENKYAEGYMPGGKFKDETRGNNAAVAAPPAPAPPAPAPPAPESVDLVRVGQAERALRHKDDALNEARIESLEENGDASAAEELSAIRAVTNTPDAVAAAAAAAAASSSAAAAENDENEDIEVALEIRTEDKSAAARAEFAAQLEDARLAQGSSPKTGVDYEVGSDGVARPAEGGSMEGGVFRGVGAAAITFEAHDASWEFLPTPTDPAVARKAVADTGLTPKNVVAYISADPQIMEKHNIVKASAYGPYALTYVASYKCNLQAFVGSPNTAWVRDERTGRLHRIDVHFPGGLQSKQINVLESIPGNLDDITCLLIPKFEQTVGTLKVADGVKAMLDIMKGLCVERDFIIDDLHADNMAVMPDGKAVTFDYDRLRKREEFEELLGKIDAYPGIYKDLPQVAHVVDKATRGDPERLFPIYDILAVLESLKKLTRFRGLSAVDACELALKGTGNTFEGRTAAVDALAAALRDVVWPKVTVVDVFNGKSPPVTGGPMRRTPGSLARAKESLAGGHRTFRRRGLPRLL